MTLSFAPDPWADDANDVGAELGLIRWAAETAGELAGELTRLAADVGAVVEARRRWSLPGHPFARTTGRRLHTRACFYDNRSPTARTAAGHRPLTTGEAEAFLRESPEHRRCAVCRPRIRELSWVRVRPASGRAGWRLADEVELP